MTTPKPGVTAFVLACIISVSVAVHLNHLRESQQCTSPTVYLYDSSASCTGEADVGPFFDSGVCSGNCSAIPNGHYSMDYKCDSHTGLHVLTSFSEGCGGPFSMMNIQTGRCSRLMGMTTSFALKCNQNDPILPPLSTQPASWGNGTFIPSLGPCMNPDDCPPGMPYRTVFSGPGCSGSASSSTFSNNAVVDGCYLVPWPFDLNVRMTCNRPSSLTFNIASNCDSAPFVSLTYPTGVCINDADGFGSSIYSCGAPSHSEGLTHPKQDPLDSENKRPRSLIVDDSVEAKKKIHLSSFTDIIRGHPLAATNPLLKKLLQKL